MREGRPRAAPLSGGGRVRPRQSVEPSSRSASAHGTGTHTGPPITVSTGRTAHRHHTRPIAIMWVTEGASTPREVWGGRRVGPDGSAPGVCARVPAAHRPEVGNDVLHLLVGVLRRFAAENLRPSWLRVGVRTSHTGYGPDLEHPDDVAVRSCRTVGIPFHGRSRAQGDWTLRLLVVDMAIGFQDLNKAGPPSGV
jgi:hypothetical protein